MTSEAADPGRTSTAEPPLSVVRSEETSVDWTPTARRIIAVLFVGLLLSLVVRSVAVQAFSIPSGSMSPTLQSGERVLVSRIDTRGGDVRRGDVVVFDGAGTFAPSPGEPTGLARVGAGAGALLGFRPGEVAFVKRVVGLPGEHVVCCDDDGRITVDGRPLQEPYLSAGESPSESPFDVVVPPGRLWLMGDHRSASADSRAHLGRPGGGTVSVDDVIGRVVLVTWPLGDVRTVDGGSGR
ncbi:signal peptidase I [Kineococcus xinjiangensis]|uniref:Signal peptidase I n=1 Tax=Kineococcus xinjiangensis TaxID=512762 RepID=A0A2S6IW57_9ACTN|nr:signal peptidase I [Kineococcus xinjiangensis]PPK98525.1 signal peptidase I [Kineococcus xinjiangensis]